MASKVAELWFHIVAHTWKNKHKSKYPIQKRLDKNSRWQQRYTDIEKRTIDQKNNSRNNSIIKKGSKRKLKSIRRYTKEQHKRAWDDIRIKERKQSSLERQ